MANENTYILRETTTSQISTINSTNSQADDETSSQTTTDTKQLVIEPTTNRLGVTSNLHQTGFNFVNSIIGSGVIGIPYSLKTGGFGFGIFLIVLIAIITDYSLCIMVKAGNYVGVNTYQDLVRASFGSPGYWLLTFIQFLYPFIAMISYNVIIGDTITKILIRLFNVSTSSLLANRNTLVFICSIFITFPLSMYRNISKLNKVSLISLFFVFVILVFIFIRLEALSDKIPHTADEYQFVGNGITESIGIIAFAYMCHHSSFLMYESLENPTQSRWNRITHISVGTSCLIILLYGIFGYVTFGQYSQGDLLENYCMSDDLANLARVLFAATICLTYPIECFVVREVLENAIWDGKPPQTRCHHIMITTAIVLTCFIFSTFTDCLGIVLELNGVLAAVPLAFILPALCYLKLDPGPNLEWQKFPAFLMVLFGFAVAIVGTFLAVVRVIDGVQCSHGRELDYCTAGHHIVNNTATSSTLLSLIRNNTITTTIQT
ncbi:putative sodium-coupled neutral amino acid transporter 11 [Oppia nitens]|uniref:putative sodium-coupled neutral amino acid transporter 11 n=1 Tax=Oppia nitens TaxID=1686743 RepID=UPI0023DAE7C9|nr:putative sodium-coupled neutral amino acid transporter 11 [Oppia nitens]